VARFLSAPGERFVFVVAFLVLGMIGLAGFYRFAVERPPRVRRRAWPGAFVAMSAFLFVSWGFGAYVSSLGSYALFYGGLAAVAVLLFWFYLSSLALLLGAELNAQLEGVRDGIRPPRP
jgi:membrane protein